MKYIYFGCIQLYIAAVSKNVNENINPIPKISNNQTGITIIYSEIMNKNFIILQQIFTIIFLCYLIFFDHNEKIQTILRISLFFCHIFQCLAIPEGLPDIPYFPLTDTEQRHSSSSLYMICVRLSVLLQLVSFFISLALINMFSTTLNAVYFAIWISQDIMLVFYTRQEQDTFQQSLLPI